MKLTDEDSGLTFEVLEVHDDHLLVMGKSGTFKISPPSPEAVCLMVEDGDPVNLIRAAEAAGYATCSQVDVDF